MEPKEHWQLIAMCLAMAATGYLGVVLGHDSPSLPAVVALAAYGVGWARYLVRRLRTRKPDSDRAGLTSGSSGRSRPG